MGAPGALAYRWWPSAPWLRWRHPGGRVVPREHPHVDGVPNRDIADGRTIDEVIEDEADWPHRGALVRHVVKVARDLARQDVLSRRERVALILATVRTDW